jgi:hypothetical protein
MGRIHSIEMPGKGQVSLTKRDRHSMQPNENTAISILAPGLQSMGSIPRSPRSYSECKEGFAVGSSHSK